jgi:hypothetical protein
VGRPLARMRASAILLPEALTTGPGPGRAARPHAGHSERRALDRGQNRGQRLTGPVGGLASFLLFLVLACFPLVAAACWAVVVVAGARADLSMP